MKSFLPACFVAAGTLLGMNALGHAASNAAQTVVAQNATYQAKLDCAEDSSAHPNCNALLSGQQ